MKREELTELHYITPIANLLSIMKWGIQSHRRVEAAREKGMLTFSIASQKVQDIRANVQIPNGRPLHEYANLYLCARNPMMFKRKEQHKEICVLRISTVALDIEGAIVTDRNAAVKFARFEPAPHGLTIAEKDLVFAEDWRHIGDPLEYKRHKAVKCAEILIPDKTPPELIFGVYVSCLEAREIVQDTLPSLEVIVNRHLFFAD